MAVRNAVIERYHPFPIVRSAHNPVNGITESGKRLVVASVTGPAHCDNDIPCQDAWAYSLRNDYLIAVVCDGAGSVSEARAGAQAGSGLIVKTLRNLTLDPADHSEKTLAIWRNAVKHGIERAHRMLSRLMARRHYDGLDAYHATVVGVVASAKGGFFFHIGDGVGVACREIGAWSDCTVSLPENGEYANETFFYTQVHWSQHLRITPFGPSEVVLLMSDGPESFVMTEGYAGVAPGFADALAAHFAKVKPAMAAEDLADTLDDPQARRISGDDKTILWMQFVQ